MTGTVSDDFSAARAATIASERAPSGSEPAVAVLAGMGGLVAGVVGSFSIAVATVVQRFLTVPFLYERPRDLYLHLTLEVVAGASVWICSWSAWALALALDARVPERARKALRMAVLACGGVAIGFAVYFLVVRPSSRSLVLAPWIWQVALPALGITLAFALARGLRTQIRLTWLVGLIGMATALLVNGVGLVLYVRHYGNLQSMLLFAVVCVSGLGGGLLLGRSRQRRDMLTVAGVVLTVCVLTLAVAGPSPSYSTRRAVLVWGGVAKRVVLSVVWPLFDRDGDGTPSRFWGLDPDDDDRDVTPRTGPKPWPAARTESLPLGVGGPTRKNLLWVTIDTVRADSFAQWLAVDPILRDGFAAFARFPQYVSCSSRSSQVADMLYGDGRCDHRRAAGLEGHSLLELLRHAGYRDELLGYYHLPVTFSEAEQIRDDRVLIERARRALDEPTDGKALFLHLKGGHAEYEAPGNAPRERYENQLRASLRAVIELVRSVSEDRWVVVILGDHGEAFGEHGSFTHASTLYEEALRTALAIRSPNLPRGPDPERIGCATLPWKVLRALGVLERDPSPLDYQYAALDIAAGELGHLQSERLRALRIGSNKAIWSPDLGVWELYDLEADPGEHHSLAESRPQDLALLRPKLEGLSRDCPPPAAESPRAPLRALARSP